MSGGDHPMALDIHCFPMCERMCMFETGACKDDFKWLDMKNECP